MTDLPAPAFLADPALQSVMALLEDHGHQVFVVGGAVRNALMDQPASDVDLCTDARPGIVTALFEAAGFRVLPTGIAHGTVTVLAGDTPFEITTFRRDVATDGRRATVAYATTITEDAGRRDFTINALYADRSGRILDPTGLGRGDIDARRLRFVGDAATRIREDALRSLRYFRFFASLGLAADSLDPETEGAMIRHADLVDGLSRERIGQELRRLLGARDPHPALAAMDRAALLDRVLPGAGDPGILARLVRAEREHGVLPDWQRRLAALQPDNPGEDLRLSRAESTGHDVLRGLAAGSMAPHEIGYRHGLEVAVNALLLRQLFHGKVPGNAFEGARAGSASVFPVKARDLMPDLSGPELGKALARAEALWIASGFRLPKAEIVAAVLR